MKKLLLLWEEQELGEGYLVPVLSISILIISVSVVIISVSVVILIPLMLA